MSKAEIIWELKISKTLPEEEGQSHAGISPENQRLESVVEAEVHATVDEDTDGGDDEASVETLDTVRLQGLDVHVNQAVELPLASLALSVIGKPKGYNIRNIFKSNSSQTWFWRSPESRQTSERGFQQILRLQCWCRI